MNIVMHPQTARLVTLLQTKLPQSVLLSGPRGVGLNSVARAIAGDNVLAFVEPRNAKEEPDDNGTISVEAIRELYIQTRAKYSTSQVVIISNADRMNTSGQSAFLKLLEEPQSSIHFIMTTHHPERLKSTILSRVQQHTVRPITADQTRELIDTLGITDAKRKAQLQYIGEGLPSEITKLIGDDDYFQKQAATIGDARTLLQGTTYDKLMVANRYHQNRDGGIRLIEVTMRMARHSMSASPQQALIHQMNRLLEAHERLLGNGNVRLVIASSAMV